MGLKACRIFFLMHIIISAATSVIAGGKPVVISGCNWEPYSGENLLNKGFYSEITVEALKSEGYETDIVIIPWKRAIVKTQEGVFDGLIGASYTDERSDYFAYPDYAWKNAMVFFSRKGQNINYTNLKDLCPASIGLLRGTLYIDRFSNVPCLKQDLAKDTLTNIKKLVFGRVDLILDSRDSIVFTINRNMPEKADTIEPVSPPYEIDRIYTVFSKKRPGYQILVRKFDEGIRKIKENGTYDRILVKHGMKP